MTRALQTGFVPNTCGVGFSSVFRDGAPGTVQGIPDIANMPNAGGAGWHVAGFTNELMDFRNAYKELREKWQIVFQSKVRINTRTGRKFFFCVYDTKKVNVDNSEFKWPTTSLA